MNRCQNGDCYYSNQIFRFRHNRVMIISETVFEENAAPPSRTRKGQLNETRLVDCGLLRVVHFASAGTGAKDVTVTELLSTAVTSSGQPIVLPQKDAQIIVSTYDVVPGASLPVHKHPHPRYAYVLSGNLRVTNVETGKKDIYKPGDFILESVEQWHTGANIGSEPVKLLVIDIVEKGQTNTVLHK
jgi:quercetin dioxygenase-like cupin family protein